LKFLRKIRDFREKLQKTDVEQNGEKFDLRDQREYYTKKQQDCTAEQLHKQLEESVAREYEDSLIRQWE